MLASERSMILADWKRDLANTPSRERGWGLRMTGYEMWCVLDYVIERLTLPNSEVYVAVHEKERVPLAWIALRGPRILHEHAKGDLAGEPELAAAVARELWSKLPRVVTRQLFNPLHELKECP